MPRWAQSIRFRLSLAYALAVFAVGAAFIAAVYAWQAHQLSQPQALPTRTIVYQDPITGERRDTDIEVLLKSDFERYVWEQLQRQAYAESLNDLRTGSLVGLGLRQLSATPRKIPEIKRVIRDLRVAEAERVAAHALTLESARQVRNYLRDQLGKILPPDGAD